MNSGALAGFCGHHTQLLMPTPKCRRGSTGVEYAAVRIPYTVPRIPDLANHMQFASKRTQLLDIFFAQRRSTVAESESPNQSKARGCNNTPEQLGSV